MAILIADKTVKGPMYNTEYTLVEVTRGKYEIRAKDCYMNASTEVVMAFTLPVSTAADPYQEARRLYSLSKGIFEKSVGCF